MSELLRHRMLMQQAGGGKLLPDGYEQLAYIDCQNASINIGTIPYSLDYEFGGKFAYERFGGRKAGEYIFDTYGRSDTTFRILLSYNSLTIYAGGVSTSGGSIFKTIVFNTEYEYKVTNGQCILNGEILSPPAGQNKSGTANLEYAYAAYCKLWEQYIKLNGEFVYRFIPCRRILDGECGFYEVVNQVFYPTSQGNIYPPS